MFDRERLHAAYTAIGAAPLADVFAELDRMYGARGRYYHDRSHIEACLDALERYETLAERPAEIAMALWYHDAIYDVRGADNEERSADLARDRLTAAGAKQAAVARIVAMILATKAHQADDGDTRLLVDIDLGILGQSPEVFERYDEAIRKKYDWVPEPRYRERRARVLQSFLDREVIYRTATFRDALEARARANLAGKIRELNS